MVFGMMTSYGLWTIGLIMCLDYFVLGLVIIFCYLFSVFNSLYLKGYVISLHRLSIGDGEIQGANGQEGQNKEDQWRNIDM